MSVQDRANEPKGGPKSGPGKTFPGSPRFNFNFYWIYGIIIVILIATQIFQLGSSEKLMSFDRFEKAILEKDIAKIEVTDKTAHVTIKKDKLSDPKFNDINAKRWGNAVNEG